VNDAEDSLGARMRRWWGHATAPQHLADPSATLGPVLDAIVQRLDHLSEQLDTQRPSPPVPPPDDGPLLTALSGLEKQVGRAGREQLKANALAEGHGQRLIDLFTALQTIESQRDRELTALREDSDQREKAARQALCRSLLPVLDGLDQALQAGALVLAQPAEPVTTWWNRFTGRPPATPERALRAAMAAWLTGLEFVQQRLLDLLKTEGIRPMEAVGLAFDPQLHVALEVAPADTTHPLGTVVSEIRRGYLLDERILRPAEVTVAR